MAQAEVLPEVTKFLEAPKMLIGGKPTDATRGGTFETIDPSTGKAFAEVPRGGVEDIDAAVAAAREAFEDRRWSSLRPGKRTEILYKLGELIKRNISELAQLEALDSGKPVSMAQGEMWVAGDVFRYYAGWPTKFFGETNPSDDNSFIFTVREPVGVCGGIIPWNFPLIMASWKVAPALAFGNSIVLKPAEQTPLTALRLAELCLEAGVPDGIVDVLNQSIGNAGGSPWISSGSPMMSATRMRGLSELNGSWKTTCISRRSGRIASRSAAEMSRPPKRMAPSLFP